MGLWISIPLLLGIFAYISTIVACGCGEKEAERLQRKAAARQQAQQQQQMLKQEMQKTSSLEKSKEVVKQERGGSHETMNRPPPVHQPLQQHPLPPGQPHEMADDGGYEACPDLSPEELKKIANQR